MIYLGAKIVVGLFHFPPLHWKYFAIPFEKKTKVLADKTPEHTGPLAAREPTFRTSGPGDGKGKAAGTKHPLRQKLP